MAPNLQPTVEPYARIVGIETAAGLVACRYAVERTPDTVQVKLPDKLIRKTSDFFEKNVTGHDLETGQGKLAGAALWGMGTMRYNCHIYALAMNDIIVTSAQETNAALMHARDTFAPIDPTRSLPAGRHGLVYSDECDDISHSFIGMGEAFVDQAGKPLALQVVNNNSHMGFMPYDQMLSEYSRYQETYALIA